MGSDMKNSKPQNNLLQEFIKNKILERLTELGMNPAELARLSGCRKSTLSEILGPNNRLPSLPTLIAFSKTLAIPLSEFLPKHYLHLDPDLHKQSRSFLPSEHLNIEEVLKLTLEYGMKGEVLYHPRSVPEFAKPPEILSLEYGLSPQQADAYHENLKPVFTMGISGLILLDETALTNIFDRKGRFSEISRACASAALNLLRSFESQNRDTIKIFVCDRECELIDPILILDTNTAVADYFGSLLFLPDPTLIEFASKRFQAITEKAPSLNNWLHSKNV